MSNNQRVTHFKHEGVIKCDIIILFIYFVALEIVEVVTFLVLLHGLHRIFKVNITTKCFAVKCLNISGAILGV